MAFVFRKSQKQNSPRCATPGPGSYFNIKNSSNNKNHQQLSPAPFNNTSNRQLWKVNNIPGPGSYTTELNIKKQNKLIGDQRSQIVVYEAPKQTNQFKSKTNRFVDKQKIQQNPGPGDYNIAQQNNYKQRRPQTSSNNNRLKQFLKSMNKHHTRNQPQKQFLQEMIRTFNNELSQQRQSKRFFRNKQPKKSVVFSSKVQRQIKSRPLTAAGPGSYNILKSSFDLDKKQLNNNSRIHPTKSINNYAECKNNQTLTQKQISKQIQQIGPGYYDIQSAYKNLSTTHSLSTKNKTLQCFGSTVDRFFTPDSSKICSIDAIYYNNNTSNHVSQKKQNKNLNSTSGSFGKQKRTVFQSKSNINLCPGAYGVYNDFSSLLKDKYKKNNKGNFGSTQQRFIDNKDSKQNIVMGVQDNNKIQNAYHQIFGQRSKFKRVQMKKKTNINKQRDYTIKKQEINVELQQSRPLCYDNLTNTISYKYWKKSQIQAPFMTTQERFKDKQQNQKDLLDFIQKQQLKEINLKKSSSSNILRNCKSAVYSRKQKDYKNGLKLTQSRFGNNNFKLQNNQLGPQYYNPNLPGKKSYNVLFS